MKHLILTTILSLTVFAIAGCGDAANDTTNAGNTAVVKNTTDNKTNSMTNAETNTSADAPKSDLKPADIDPNKPVSITDLKAAYIADKAAWNGKEVSVTGNYFGKGNTSKSGKTTSMYVSITDSSRKLMGTCYVSEEVSDEISKNPENHVFKGTIKEEKSQLVEQVVLDPCEVVK